jgi:ABC-type nitrate/sulfonate/bicarbonate transport system substrate-binding protein
VVVRVLALLEPELAVKVIRVVVQAEHLLEEHTAAAEQVVLTILLELLLEDLAVLV